MSGFVPRRAAVALSFSTTKAAAYFRSDRPAPAVEHLTLFEAESFEPWGYRPAKSFELTGKEQILALRDFLNGLYPPAH